MKKLSSLFLAAGLLCAQSAQAASFFVENAQVSMNTLNHLFQRVEAKLGPRANREIILRVEGIPMPLAARLRQAAGTAYITHEGDHLAIGMLHQASSNNKWYAYQFRVDRRGVIKTDFHRKWGSKYDRPWRINPVTLRTATAAILKGLRMRLGAVKVR